MNLNKLNGITAILMLTSAAVFAADAHQDHPPAAAPAADSHATPSKDAQAKDTATLAADDSAKPAPAKKVRKQARAKPLHKAPTHGTQADTHGATHQSAPAAHGAQNTSAAHGTPHANETQSSKRLRVKDRSAAVAPASHLPHASDASHDSPAAPPSHAADTSPATHAAPAAKAGHDAPAAHEGHDAAGSKDHAAAHAAPAGKDSHDTHTTPAAHQTSAAKDSQASHHDAHASPAAHAIQADSHAATDKASHAAGAADYCNPPLKSEVAALFDRWNASLRTGDPKKVAANYAPGSILLPTVSNRPRFTAAEKEDYFAHFLARRPEGTIDDRVIEVDCNSATDAGLYTFRFADSSAVKARYSFSYRKVGSQWLITSHHSSGMPEKAEVAAEHPVSGPAHAKPAERAEQGSPAKGWVRYP